VTRFTPGFEPPEPSLTNYDTALIIGAGIAGCAIASSLSRKGFRCKLFDKLPHLASATSSVPVAINQPYISRTEQITSRYFRRAFAHSQKNLRSLQPPSHTANSVIHGQTGVLRLVDNPADWSNNSQYDKLSRKQVSDVARVDPGCAALHVKKAGWVNLQAWCKHTVASMPTIEFNASIEIKNLRKTAYGWQLLTADGKIADESRLVIIANSFSLSGFKQCSHLPLQHVGGQISFFPAQNGTPQTSVPVSGKCYVIPAETGYWVGATHQRNVTRSKVDSEDDRHNYHSAVALLPNLDLKKQASRSWTGTRCATPDRLPVVGPLPDRNFYRSEYADLHHGRPRQQFPRAVYEPGLFVMAGFGSRAATQVTYAAEHLASVITQPEMIDTDTFTLLHPARFLLKDLRRRQPHTTDV